MRFLKKKVARQDLRGEKCDYLLFGYNVPTGCKCFLYLQNNGRSERYACGEAFCAARFLGQSELLQEKKHSQKQTRVSSIQFVLNRNSITISGIGAGSLRGHTDRHANKATQALASIHEQGTHLLSLVRLGHSCVWDDLCSIDDVRCQVCHLVALGKATLSKKTIHIMLDLDINNFEKYHFIYFFLKLGC